MGILVNETVNFEEEVEIYVEPGDICMYESDRKQIMEHLQDNYPAELRAAAGLVDEESAFKIHNLVDEQKAKICMELFNLQLDELINIQSQYKV